MSKSTAATRISPELRAGAFYFTMFMSSGVVTAYAGIWFVDRGLSAAQIGIINALPIFIMLVLNFVVGRIADRASDWRQVIVIGAILGAVFPFGLFFVDDFWGILLVWTLAAIPIASIGPVLDAATMRMTRRNGTNYGAVRAGGTVGYMVIAITGLSRRLVRRRHLPLASSPASNVLRALVSVSGCRTFAPPGGGRARPGDRRRAEPPARSDEAVVPAAADRLVDGVWHPPAPQRLPGAGVERAGAGRGGYRPAHRAGRGISEASSSSLSPSSPSASPPGR